MIRKAEASDIKECVRVIREGFKTVADEFDITPENAPRFTAFATTEERLLYQLSDENRHMYVHTDGGNITGYRGTGAKLLEYAFEAARALGCSRMEIGIVEENRVLRRWYEGFGFVHTGVKKFEFFPFTCGYMEKKL